jgi:UDP-galactopyranose mutase
LSHEREGDWLAQADLMLSATSWDTTQARMAALIDELLGIETRTGLPAILVAAE